jgi:hypothetical protein
MELRNNVLEFFCPRLEEFGKRLKVLFNLATFVTMNKECYVGHF